MTYSVLNEPVIPVLWCDGSSGSVGIREAFLRAHEIRDVQGDTPLERYALMRLLIAFAMDMLHPKDSFERRDLLDAGKFDPETFEAYVAMCEKDGPRFDLFDPDHPFLQSAYDEKLDAKAKKPVTAIVHALPTGNNHVFIDHHSAASHHLSVPKVFRALCASYVYCVSGLAGPSCVNNTPPVYTVMVGDNLFTSIIGNMLSVAEAQPLPYGIGCVPWRKFPVVLPREKVADLSLLEGLTWMPRRITLVADPDMTVSTVYCQAGLDFKGNDLWDDPHVPKYRKKDGTFGTVKPELGRAMWRDIGTLLYDRDRKAIRQPQALRCLSNLYDEYELPALIPIRSAGLVTNQAAYVSWSEDELTIPSTLLRDEEQAEILRMDVSRIESIQSYLFSVVQRCVDKPRATAVSKEKETAIQAQQFFLQGAHDLLFGPLMDDIVQGIPEKEHVDHFCEGIRDLLRSTIREVINTSGNNARAMTQQIDAEKQIWGLFTKLTKEWKECYNGA